MHLLSKDRWTHAQRGSHFLCQPHEPMDVHMLKQARTDILGEALDQANQSCQKVKALYTVHMLKASQNRYY